MSAEAEWELVKDYIMFRARQWLSVPGNLQRDLAVQTGLSTGWVSALVTRKREDDRLGEEKAMVLLDWMCIRLADAVALSQEWNTKRPRLHQTIIESVRLHAALVELREEGFVVSQWMRGQALEALARGDKSRDEWKLFMERAYDQERALLAAKAEADTNLTGTARGRKRPATSDPESVAPAKRGVMGDRGRKT